MMLPRNRNEMERVKALERYRLLDTFPEPAFERITELAAEIFRAPVALISLVHSERVWFKSHSGIMTKEIARRDSYCSAAILGEQVLVIPDTTIDPWKADRHALEGFPFYAGAPLRTLDRYNLGALCVLDTKARHDWTPFMSRVLSDLAAIIVDEMELRRMASSRRQMEGAFTMRQLSVA
jgi:GAF domain-containing protein